MNRKFEMNVDTCKKKKKKKKKKKLNYDLLNRNEVICGVILKLILTFM